MIRLTAQEKEFLGAARRVAKAENRTMLHQAAQTFPHGSGAKFAAVWKALEGRRWAEARRQIEEIEAIAAAPQGGPHSLPREPRDADELARGLRQAEIIEHLEQSPVERAVHETLTRTLRGVRVPKDFAPVSRADVARALGVTVAAVDRHPKAITVAKALARAQAEGLLSASAGHRKANPKVRTR